MNLTNVSKYAISSNWRFAKENRVVIGTLTKLRYIHALVPVFCEANHVQGFIFFGMSHGMRSNAIVHLPALSVTGTEAAMSRHICWPITFELIRTFSVPIINN
jgi:hypothetical protein